MTLEPKDKLDATAIGRGERTGGRAPRLGRVDWRAGEENVRRLRQRIFTASQAGDLKRVRSLQKLMLRSRANTLSSVRRVTERNAGRKTAGIDGKVVLTPEAKMELAGWVQHSTEPFMALPVRRVYIPKSGQREAAPARYSRDCRQRASSTGRRTRWSPSGRRGSSRGPMGFGRAVAAMTRSRRSTGRQGQKPEAPVGARRGFGGGVRPNRPRSPSRASSARSPPGEWSGSG